MMTHEEEEKSAALKSALQQQLKEETKDQDGLPAGTMSELRAKFGLAAPTLSSQEMYWCKVEAANG